MNNTFSKRAAIMTALQMADITVNAADDEDIKKVEEDPEGGTVDIEIKTERPEAERTYEPVIPDVEMQMECQRLLCALQGAKYLLSKDALSIVGSESMSDLLTAALKTVVNTSSRFAGLFRTYIFHGFDKFKRGEVTYFRDMHRYEYNQIFEKDFEEVKNRVLPHPRGMESNFAQAYKALRDYLDILDMGTRVKAIVEAVNGVHRSLLSDNPKFNAITVTSNALLDKNLEKAFAATSKCFTTSNKDTDIFSNLFEDMKDFKKQMENLIDADTDLRMVNTIYKSIEGLDSTMQSIESMKESITKDDINTLATAISVFGMTFSNYATAINDLQRLGHAGNNILENFLYLDE